MSLQTGSLYCPKCDNVVITLKENVIILEVTDTLKEYTVYPLD